jgi:hypothetical protein
MPTKQTRETIEAELLANELDRVVARIRETQRDFEEFENDLREHEKARGITPVPDKPLVQRMAAVGMPREAINRVSEMLGAVTKIGLGSMDESPDRIRRELAETADAEISALDQLHGIIESHRKRRQGLAG